MSDIVYFELNNWFAGRDYPNAEPFLTWLGNDLKLYFSNNTWVKEQKLCVVKSVIDMSVNYCITATKEWVLKNCPDLLSDKTIKTEFIYHNKDGEYKKIEEHPYSSFLRFPEEDDDDEEPPKGRFGCPFLDYSEENIGIRFWDEEGSEG